MERQDQRSSFPSRGRRNVDDGFARLAVDLPSHDLRRRVPDAESQEQTGQSHLRQTHAHLYLRRLGRSAGTDWKT